MANCLITGTILRADGTPFEGVSIKVTKVRQGETVVSSLTQSVDTADVNGLVSFNLIQGSLTTIQGTFWLNNYNFNIGIEMYIPIKASANFEDLKSSADALLALITPTVFAPNNATFITQTPSSDLSAEQALSALATGLLKSTTTTGVLSIATAADLPTGIDAAKIADGTVSNAKFQLLDGVTSGIQSQLDGKQATGNYITALTGDVAASGPGSVAATLATVNGNVGSFTNANITVNAKGL